MNPFQVTSEHQESAPNGWDNPTHCFRFLGAYTDETRLKNQETVQSSYTCDPRKSSQRPMHSNTKTFLGARSRRRSQPSWDPLKGFFACGSCMVYHLCEVDF